MFFEKWPQGVLKNMERNKVMKYEHIWSVRWSMTRDYLPGGFADPPPCRIGLKVTKKPDKWKNILFQFYHCLWKNVSTSDLRCPQLPRLKKWNLGNISQPRPVHFRASAYGLGLKHLASASKNFSSTLFFYLGNFGQISNQMWTNFSSEVVSTKIETKY